MAETSRRETWSDGWSSIPFVPAAKQRRRIGVLASAIDDNIERDLSDYLRDENVAISATRMTLPAPDHYHEMEDQVVAASRGLLPNAPLDVFVFGCTAIAVTVGPDVAHAWVRTVRPDVPIVDPMSAILTEVRKAGAASVGIVTPYPPILNLRFKPFFDKHGVKVVGGVAIERSLADLHIQPEATTFGRAIEQLLPSKPDCVVISCAALRTEHIIQGLGTSHGIPVISSNQAMTSAIREILARPAA